MKIQKITRNHVFMAACIIGGILLVQGALRQNTTLLIIAGILMAPAFIVAFRLRF